MKVNMNNEINTNLTFKKNIKSNPGSGKNQLN